MKSLSLTASTLLISSLFLTVSCSDECMSPACLDTAPDIDLRIPQEGQRSYFLGYSSTCEEPDRDFEFNGDTLVVEVLETAGGIEFHEYYTPGSASLNSPIMPPVTDEIYPVKVEGDYMLLTERTASALFWFYGNDTLWLQPPAEVPLSQNGCQLMLDDAPFIGIDQGRLDRFRFGPLDYQNDRAVSCVPGWIWVEAYLMHTGRTFHLSHVVEGGQVSGWALMER